MRFKMYVSVGGIMEDVMRLVKDYMKDEALRHELNELT